VLGPALHLSRPLFGLAVELLHGLLLTVFEGLLGLVLVMEADNDGGKVALALTDVATVGLEGEGALGPAKHWQREAAEGPDEGFDGRADLIGVVDVR
jgi:hypothetical protein